MNNADCKFLTEKMGEKWHDLTDTYPLDPPGSIHCDTCEEYVSSKKLHQNRAFTTWNDFGAVWEWAQKQEWWHRFHLWLALKKLPENLMCGIETIEYLINKDRFPQLILEWVREREKELRKWGKGERDVDLLVAGIAIARQEREKEGR